MRNISLSEDAIEALVEYAKLGLKVVTDYKRLTDGSSLEEKTYKISRDAEIQRTESHIFEAEQAIYRAHSRRLDKEDWEEFSKSKENWIEGRR
jgi:hypothetical protein